jgi:ribonucleoside-diphosphate reductase alpha chain
MLDVMQMHRDAVEQIDPACPEYLRTPPANLWTSAREAGKARLPQRPGDRARSHRHDQLHDGLRHHRHRARHRPGEVQAARRRRDDEDRQPHGPPGAETLGYDEPEIEAIILVHRSSTTRSRGARTEGRAPAGVRLCVQAGQRRPQRSAGGPTCDDGRRPAVPLRGHLQDGQHAREPRPRTSPRPTSKAGSWGSRRWRSTATARSRASRWPPARKGTARRRDKPRSWPKPRRERLPTPGSRSRTSSAWGARRVHHRRPVSRRPPGRTVHHDGQGREHHRRPDGRLRHGDLDEPAVRRAAGSAGQQVLAHAVRADPGGPTPTFRIAKSVVDYIFRWLGITFMPGFREAQAGLPAPAEGELVEAGEMPSKGAAAAVPKSSGRPAAPSGTNGHAPAAISRFPVALSDSTPNGWSEAASSERLRSEQFAQFQSDAPACDNCGSITVRNGNCYLCHNCGNSMGCS